MILVVIINYHSQTLVCSCLDQLKGLRREDLGYLVIDNSERPETELIETRHPDAIIHRSPKNIGFAGGCNIGFRWATKINAHFVLLLNPDIRMENDFIRPLAAALEADPRAGMAGPVILEDTPARRLWQGSGRLNWWLGGPIHRCRKFSYADGPIGVPFLSGCAMLIRGDVIAAVGLMDEGYFLYFEDIDYCQRFIRNGWRLILVPQAHILHAQSSTVGRHSPAQVYYLSRNRIWLIRRWVAGFPLVTFILFNIFFKIPLMAMVFGIFERRSTLIAAYLKGFVDGLKILEKSRLPDGVSFKGIGSRRGQSVHKRSRELS
jgi:GT2 family glycosyltransferase